MNKDSYEMVGMIKLLKLIQTRHFINSTIIVLCLTKVEYNNYKQECKVYQLISRSILFTFIPTAALCVSMRSIFLEQTLIIFFAYEDQFTKNWNFINTDITYEAEEDNINM